MKPKKFPCSRCGKFYSNKHSLTAHALIHTASKSERFHCDAPGCNYSAVQKGNLESHKRTHNDSDRAALKIAGKSAISWSARELKPARAEEQIPVITPVSLSEAVFVFTRAAGESDISFDRVSLPQLVKSFGGTVCDTIQDVLALPTSWRRFLIAPGPCRTDNFLHALAYDIPCVSHRWLLEGINRNFEPYRLFSGYSVTAGAFVKWQQRRGPLFSQLQIGLLGDKRFSGTFCPILEAGLANVRVISPTTVSTSEMANGVVFGLSILVCQDKVTAERLSHLTVPKVSHEWIVQTLIHGTCHNAVNYQYC